MTDPRLKSDRVEPGDRLGVIERAIRDGLAYLAGAEQDHGRSDAEDTARVLAAWVDRALADANRGAVEEIERLRGEIAGAVTTMGALGLPKAAEVLRSALDVKWGQ